MKLLAMNSNASRAVRATRLTSSSPSYGLNLANDGRMFFTTTEQFVLRDTNEKE